MMKVTALLAYKNYLEKERKTDAMRKMKIGQFWTSFDQILGNIINPPSILSTLPPILITGLS